MNPIKVRSYFIPKGRLRRFSFKTIYVFRDFMYFCLHGLLNREFWWTKSCDLLIKHASFLKDKLFMPKPLKFLGFFF